MANFSFIKLTLDSQKKKKKESILDFVSSIIKIYIYIYIYILDLHNYITFI